jgi:hypothetical protein
VGRVACDCCGRALTHHSRNDGNNQRNADGAEIHGRYFPLIAQLCQTGKLGSIRIALAAARDASLKSWAYAYCVAIMKWNHFPAQCVARYYNGKFVAVAPSKADPDTALSIGPAGPVKQ